MSIFTNIHKIASRLIPREKVEFRIAGDSYTDDYGIRHSTFGEWHEMMAHVHPGIVSSFGGRNIEERDYKDMGLDFSHRFMTVWCDDKDIRTICGRDSADQLRIRSMVFNVIHVADWIVFNGWKRFYCEEVINEHGEQESS